jgi:endonuclease/exonuclease/phosphatase family metal-dependent hydrolase
VAVVLLVATMLPLIPKLRLARWVRSYGPRLLFVALSVAGVLWGYFGSGILASLALIVVQAMVLVGLAYMLLNPLKHPSRAGISLAVGMLLFMILNFLNAFAFTYPYTLPEMRGMGWVVYLAAMLTFGFGITVHRATKDPPGGELRSWWAALAGLVVLVIAVFSAWPKEADPLPDSGMLRLATYNIHYGYDDVWHLTLEDQVRAIRNNEVDVIAMQEVDAGRMTSYAVDNAYFLARQLGMNDAYLPAVEHLTGIAVLYRGPVAPTRQMLLTSIQEQTGIVGVSIQAAAGDLDFYGIWMGLSDEDTQTQIDEAIEFIGDSSPAAFGGDFNARPDEAVALTVLEAGFIEPFVALGQDPAPPTSPAINPRSQIDYVWIRGLLPMEAWVPDALSSDHRMVVVEVSWPR